MQAGASLTLVLTTLHAHACENLVPGGYSPNPFTVAKMISSLMCKTTLEASGSRDNVFVQMVAQHVVFDFLDSHQIRENRCAAFDSRLGDVNDHGIHSNT